MKSSGVSGPRCRTSAPFPEHVANSAPRFTAARHVLVHRGGRACDGFGELPAPSSIFQGKPAYLRRWSDQPCKCFGLLIKAVGDDDVFMEVAPVPFVFSARWSEIRISAARPFLTLSPLPHPSFILGCVGIGVLVTDTPYWLSAWVGLHLWYVNRAGGVGWDIPE